MGSAKMVAERKASRRTERYGVLAWRAAIEAVHVLEERGFRALR